MFRSSFVYYLSVHSLSIVEYANQEDAQRAVKELSEVPLLARPVFIREVCLTTLPSRVDF